MWQGRDGPLNYIESLKEAPLGWLQGMTNGNSGSMMLLLSVCAQTALTGLSAAVNPVHSYVATSHVTHPHL